MRTRVMTAIACALFGLPLAQQASAGSASGTITNLIVRDSDGLVYVWLSGAASGRPSCASGTSYWMIPDETSDKGKRLYAALLAARISGISVHITGKNTCLRWHDGEDIESFHL